MNIQPKTQDDSDSCVNDSKIKLSLLFLSDRPSVAFSALTMSVGHPACKKTEWWDAGVVICLERGANLHMAQLMPLPLTVSCFVKIQIGFSGTGPPG